MGAVKTNRRRKALFWSLDIEKKYGIVQKLDRLYDRNMQLEHHWLDILTNNRRKMARLPMIRRARA